MSDISTINGRSIFNYNDYADGHSAAEQAAFEESAKVPVAGKYDPSTDTVETKTVELSTLMGGGGSGLPPTTGKQGHILTVNSSEEAVWDEPPKSIKAVSAGTGIIVTGSGSISVGISTSNASDGDVLTYNNGDVSWIAPQGGGGGDSNIAFLEFTVVKNSSDNKFHLTAASMTPQEIVSAIESGKSVLARCARTLNNTIESVIQIPLSKYYNEDAYYPGSGNYNIWFGGTVGSGGADAPYFNISNMGGGLYWESSQWEVSDIDGQ